MEQWIINDSQKIRLTTVALSENEFLKPIFHSSIVETYCEGYQLNDNGRITKRKDLDGHYFTKELNLKPVRHQDFPKDGSRVHIK